MKKNINKKAQKRENRMMIEGDAVMLMTGKYTSFHAEFISYKGDRKVKVNVDLSPKRIIRSLFMLERNVLLLDD